MLDEIEEPLGPPPATVAKRAQSYADFHYAVQAVLGQDEQPKSKTESSETEIVSDLDFADWYNDLENQLLDSSHNNYV